MASRGDRATALRHLAEHRLDHLFCAVEVGWGRKSDAIQRIAADLGIALDAIAFTDNDPVELAEVAMAVPAVRRYPADSVAALPDLVEFRPEHITAEARHRRRSYRDERERAQAEERFEGSSAEFLATLGLVMAVGPAIEDDLTRAHELTVRTHQLNTTGRTFDLNELRTLRASDEHEVLVADLADRFGDYGTIGLAVLAHTGGDTVLELLLMSCRVLSRGVGATLLGHIARDAAARGKRPVARFVRTPVNQVMLVTLRFAGFTPVEGDDDQMLLALPPDRTPPPPAHVRLIERSPR